MDRVLRMVVRTALVSIVVGGVVAIAVWRWIGGTSRLQAWLADTVHDETGIHVAADDVGIGFGGLTLHGVTLSATRGDPMEGTPDGTPLLRVDAATVRPEWRPLLHGEVVIGTVVVDGARLTLHRDAHGSWNFDDLRAAPSPATEDAAAASAPHGESRAAIHLHRLEVRDATIEVVDELDRPAEPLRLAIDVALLNMKDLAGTSPASFEIEARTSFARDSTTTLRASGTFTTTPAVAALQSHLDQVDVDALVSLLGRPGESEGPEPGPLDFGGLRVGATVEAGLVRYGGFDFADAHVAATIDGTALEVGDVRADLAGGRVRGDARIDFGVPGFRYEATATIHDVDLSRASRRLAEADWGRHAHPTASGRAHGRARGTRLERLLDTLSLDAALEIDAVDLGALSGIATASERRRAASDEPRLGPYDTGGAEVTATLSVARADLGEITLAPLRASVALSGARLRVAPLDATVARGSLEATADVDLARPGLAYSASASLVGARIEDLTRGLPVDPWGTRTGVVGATVELRGAGTDEETVLRSLEATGHLSWTDGRVANSKYLREISRVTGIPGFRDLPVVDSGGSFVIRDGSASTERIRLWGPEAGIQTAGRVDLDGEVDAEVALAIGPTSNRELFSTGIALPYVYGKDGWRFVPLRVTGNLSDPTVTIPPKGVLHAALTTLPGAGAGAVSTGLEATGSVLQRGTDAIETGSRALLPGPAGRALGGVARQGGNLVERGGRAIGSVIDGVGGLLLPGSEEMLGDPAPPDDTQPRPTSGRR